MSSSRSDSVKWLSSPEGGKVAVHPIGKYFQRVAHEPSSLVSIFGRAREGKSFLMNCLACRHALFGVSNSHDPCTQGIDVSKVWMPLKDFSTADGGTLVYGKSNVQVGFLDAEGQGDKDVSYDANLICPILLVSKCVIFNWKGDLQKDLLLSSLGVMARAAQNVAMDSNAGKKGVFGHLHIVFRDWQSHDTTEKSCLAVQDALFRLERSGPGHDARNRIRTLILESFTSVRVWLFDPPSEYTKDLKQKLVFERTSDVFRTQVRALREALSQQLKEPTYLAGNVLTGRNYIPLTEQIADALNNGRAVLPSSAYLNVIAHDLQNALSLYRCELQELTHTMLSAYPQSLSESGVWVDIVRSHFDPQKSNSHFTVLTADAADHHTTRMTNITGSTSVLPDSPLATLLNQYASQTKEIFSSAEVQFSALRSQKFTHWLHASLVQKRSLLTQTLSESADVAEAMLCQVCAQDISPLHSGDDAVECYANEVCAQIVRTMAGTLAGWLLYNQAPFEECLDVDEEGVYTVTDCGLAQDPCIEAFLQEEALFMNDLRAAVYGQAPPFKAQWRLELGEGHVHSVHTPPEEDSPPSRQECDDDITKWNMRKHLDGSTAPVAESTDHEDTLHDKINARAKRGSLLRRLAVSIDEQRVRARSWAQSTLGLRFDTGESSAGVSAAAPNVPAVSKSFAQQKRDSLQWARRLFGAKAVAVEAGSDEEDANTREFSENSFVHIDADSTESRSEGFSHVQPVSPVSVPVRAPVPIYSSPARTTPSDSGIKRPEQREARTPAQSGVRPSTPVLDVSDSEVEIEVNGKTGSETKEVVEEPEELVTDTISEITGAFVVPPAQPKWNHAGVSSQPSPQLRTQQQVPPFRPPSRSGHTLNASRAQTPALEPSLSQYYKRCLADIYAHTTRCDSTLIATVLSQDSPTKSLKRFEDNLCHTLRCANRNLATLLSENDCIFFADVDFNTERPSRSSLESDPAGRRSPSPDRRDSTSRASLGSGLGTRTESTLTSDSAAGGISGEGGGYADRGNAIFKAGAYQVRFKEPVISKANCIYFHLFGRDRFIKAKVHPLSQRTLQGGVRRRSQQLVEDGFTFGGRRFHFLGGEGGDRGEGKAYFFATHDDFGLLPPISVSEVRAALADFDQIGRAGEAIKPTKLMAASKTNARLMLGFSPTYPALQLTDKQVIVIRDVLAGDGGIMTDGCGFISASLLKDLPFAIANGAKFCARRLPNVHTYRDDESHASHSLHSSGGQADPEGEMSALAALPNTIQIRLSCYKGLFKGCLTVTTDVSLCPENCVVMRDSMLKVGGPVHISPHMPCTLFVNRTFEKTNALAPGSFVNAPAGIGGNGGNPWTANFSVDLALLLCHLGLPLDHVLRLAMREVDEIGDIAHNRSAAMETVHRILRRFDRKDDPDDADYCSDEDEMVDQGLELPPFGADSAAHSIESSSHQSENSDLTGTNYQSAAHSMYVNSETAAMKAFHFLIAGHSLQEPQLQRYLSRLQVVALDKLRRLKFRLPNSAYLVGVPDPYNQLKEGEVFAYLPLGDSELRTSAVIHNCEVLVTRYPLHHPGDIRKLRAVQNDALSALVGQSSNAVLFFSTQGRRSQADKMGGGDFDGDEYCLIFNQTIVNAVTTVAPYDPSDFPPTVSAAPAVVKDPTLRDGMGVELLHAMLHHANHNKVGLYSTLWLAFADRDPASAGAKMYDHLARLALDAAKTGMESVSLDPPDLTEKPHYLGAKLTNIKSVYHSETVVGVVTDVIGQRVTALQPLPAAPVADPDIYCVIENGEVIFDVTVEIAYRHQRQLNGHEVKWDLWERWKTNFDNYRIGVGQLSSTVPDATSSNTNINGNISTNSGLSGVNSSSADNLAQMQSLKSHFIDAFDTEARLLHEDPRYQNFTGYTARRVLASIVYHLTYENCKSFANFYRVGFCWEVCPTELHDNKKRSNMRRAHQHEFDLLPAMYWKDMYNL